MGNILDLIASGRLLTCFDSGFRFVKLPPFMPAGQRLPIAQRPSTFNLIESAFPLDDKGPVEAVVRPADQDVPFAEQVVDPAERAALEADNSDESEMGPPPDEDPHDNRISGWREGRRRAGATRRGPGRTPPRSAT